MKNIENLYQHGGNIYVVKQRLALDFSANINPLGIPAGIKRLLGRQLKNLVHYPDPAAHRLTAALARYWKIKEENILVGNGSTELIYLILSAFGPGTVTLTAPSFTEYERAARISKCRVSFLHLPENKGFSFDPSCVRKSEMVFLCNPNNPTGNLMISDRAGLIGIPAKTIIVDEAFMDFVQKENAHTFIPQAAKSKKLIVLRTLTKLFALPGLRIGYLVAHRDTIRTLKKYQMPWNVSVLAQTAAEHALTEEAFRQRSRELIERERKFLYERLNRIKGLRPYSSVANFLLVKIEDRRLTSSILKKRLLKKSILIRNCENFRGLNKQFIRVSVRIHKENMRLVQALEECV
ncbi:MAG: threonine-phosphate decarboxylase [Candidatus Omnitrophica bacterium]|nr:threonine-phosphate decarboxylase [Candidatus Omnitrophota bacterium]